MFRVFARMKNNGVSLRRLNVIMAIIGILASIALFIAMDRTTKIHQQTQELTKDFFSWRSDAYDMQLASDYLTEQIRCFSVTGEWRYLTNYFLEAKEAQRRERALSELEENLGKTKTLTDLVAAMEDSVHLMDLEYYAGRLTVESFGLDLSEAPLEIQNVTLTAEDEKLSALEKRERAQTLLFGEEYRVQKESISAHMQECLKDLMVDIDCEQDKVTKTMQEQVQTEHILTVVLIVIMLGTMILVAWTVFRPLRIGVEMIRNEKDIPLKGAYEVRFLAKTYNLMFQAGMKSQEKLAYEATHDNLTGLYNRRGYDFLIQNVDWETSALILLDLDDFKKVNDEHGHDVGDIVLKRAASAILKSFRSQDFVCRIGGDEFAVIMVHSYVGLTDLIRKKVEAMNEVLEQGDETVPAVTISAGVAFGHQDQEKEALFKQADEALYRAKDMGKRGIAFYE